ncbi:MAG: hypothetical protein GW854_01610 [Erythrobacter sp.]|nr:hypothetical protein [Erythrobacter sp.]
MSGAPVSLGRIYAKLCDETHDWNAEADRVDDLPHFGITISEEEGEFPVLEVAFENTGVGVDALVGGRERILLSVDRLDADLVRVDTILLYDGVLDDTGDVELGSEDVTLRYEARRANWQALRDAVLVGVALPFADPCAGDLSDPVERLDGIPALVCWDRTTRQPILSSAVNGGGGVDRNIGRNHRQGACRVIRNGRPLGRVDVVISAEWTQRQIGEFDVGAMIEDATAEQGGLSTLTPDVIADRWPEDGDDFSGGYAVSESRLASVSVPQGAQELVQFEQAAAAARTFRPGATQPQPVQIRRHWLAPTLKLAATSETKRREEVRFSVYNGGQGASTDSETVEINLDRLAFDAAAPEWQPNVRYGQGAVVSFAGFIWRSLEPHDSGESLWIDRAYDGENGTTLYRWELVVLDGSPLGSPMAASFFNTERGRQSIDHGIAVALQRLAYSQRSYTIDIEVDAFAVLDISCRDTVRLVSDRIPGVGGEAVGKVRGYTFRFSVSEATCIISLAVSTGSGVAGGTGERTIAFGPNWSRAGYAAPVYNAPFAPGIGVSKVEIINTADEQIAALQQAATAGQDLSKVIDDVRTEIRVSVLPAGGGETLAPIMVNVTPYQGFKGIALR